MVSGAIVGAGCGGAAVLDVPPPLERRQGPRSGAWPNATGAFACRRRRLGSPCRAAQAVHRRDPAGRPRRIQSLGAGPAGSRTGAGRLRRAYFAATVAPVYLGIFISRSGKKERRMRLFWPVAAVLFIVV